MNNILKIKNAKFVTSKLLQVCCAMFFCITASYAQINVVAVNTDPYCIGASSGSIKLTATGGTAPYTFQMMSPSVGATYSNASTYTYTGLAAGTYQFKIVDFNGNIQSRTIVLANPAPVSYNFVTPWHKMLVCDSIDVSPYQYTTGTARPNYKLEVWVNSNTATGLPTMTFNSVPSFGVGSIYFRIPLANFNTNSVMRVTDSCGNVSNALSFVSANITYGAVPSKTVCNATDMEVLFNGLLAPATFNLYAGSAAIGSPLQTITQNIVKQSTSNGFYQTGGLFTNLLAGTYTITGTDACGKTYTRAVNFTPITKYIPSAAASNACAQTTVDSTASFRVGSSTWSTPYTFTIVSGPTSYVHTNTAGVLNTSISYPMSITSSNKNYIEISNMPMGTYRIAVLDSCGWTDTVTYVVDASNIAKISMTGTVTPGCLNANSLTVNVKDGCSRPEQSVHLLNSSGTDLGASGLTSSNTNFTVNNLPAGNYYFALYGISTGSFTSGGTSILQHVTTPVSMKVPFTINPYVQPSVSGVLVAPCPNTSVGSLIATPLNGVAPYTYELMAPSPSTTVLAGPQASNTFSGLATNNTYRIRVTDLCGNASVSSNVSLNSLSTTLTASASPLGCIVSGSAVTLTADTLNATVYSWSGPNGFTATGRTVTIPNVTSINAGTYTVTSTTVGSCVNTATVVLNVKPNAGTDITGVCNGGTQSLTGLPAGGTWAAQASNPSGASITSNIATFSLLANGSYNFIYTLNGCTDTVAVAVTTCTLAITNTCPSSTANLTTHVDSTGKPSGTIITWHTGTPATDANKVANPASVGAGVYYAAYWDALIGCYSPASASLVVNITPCCPAIAPAITPTSFTVCSPSTVNLLSLPITSTLQTGERLVFSTHNPPANSIDTLTTAQATTITTTGMYYAFYKNAYCVGPVDSVQITVNAKPSAGLDHTIECGNAQLTDTLKGLPSGGVWIALSSNPAGVTLGNITNGVAAIGLPSAPTTGTYSFVYTVNGCSDTMTVTIGVSGNPSPSLNMGTNPICENGTAQLCPTVWGWSNYQWYKNGVAIASPMGTGSCLTLGSADVGSYTLAGQNSGGCWSSQSAAIVVSYNPNCTSTLPSGCNMQAVVGVNSLVQCVTNNSYQFTSTVTGGTAPYTYYWDFNDGTYSTQATPAHVYATYGEHDVTLIVKDSKGCEAHASTVQIYIGAKPAGSFVMYDHAGTGSGISFNSTSTIGNGWMTYQWDLGNGTTSMLSNPGPIYYAAGTYTVKMIVTGNIATGTACADTVTKTIIVDANGNICLAAVASFTASVTSACLTGNAFSFSNTSSNATSSSWNFGDGSALATTASASHSYTAAGTYTVTLTGTNSCGSSSATQTITISTIPAAPAAITGGSTVAAGSTMPLASTTIGGVWSSSNIAVATVNPITGVVTGLAAGSATISYTVSNTCGNNNATKAIIVTGAVPPPCTAPVAGFSINASSQCLGGNTFIFTNSSTGTTPTYSWTYGDGSAIAITNNGSYSYAAAGIYTVTLTATNACGTNSTTQIVTVKAASASSTIVTVCSSALPYTWNSTAYNAAGTYTKTLTNAAGCDSVATLVLTVNSAPVQPAAISGSVGIVVGNSTTLSSTTAGGVWSSSNTAVATVNPSTGVVTGVATGSVTITYTVTNSCGSNSSNILVTVNTACVTPVANFTVNTATQCIGGNSFVFTNTTTGTASGYTWNFGDGSSTVASPTHTYASAGTYTVTLQAASGCGGSSKTISVTVLASPVVPVISGNTGTIVGGTTTLSATPAGGVWSSSNTAVATVNPSTGVVTGVTAGNATITYTVTTTCGTASASTAVGINCNLQASFGINNPTQCVIGNSFVYTSSVTGGVAPYTYAWNFHDGSVAATANPTKVYATHGEGNVQLQVTDSRGCVATASPIRQLVGAQPTASFSVIDNTGTGTSKTFISSSTIPAGSMSYAWNFGNGQTSTSINPTVGFVPGNYTVTLVVKGNGGCTVTATQSITQSITSSVSIYPNPVLGQVDVSFRSASVTPTTVQILDLSGRLIQTQTMTPAYTGQQVNATFNMGGIQSGSYVIKIIDQQNGILATKTMLKQ